MAKPSIVHRVDDERAQLLALTTRGTVAARRLRRAPMVRHADTGLSDDAMAQALHSGTATVERLGKRGGEEGLAAALRERPRPGGQRTLDGTPSSRPAGSGLECAAGGPRRLDQAVARR